MQLQPHAYRMLVTDPPLNPRQNQKLMLEVMLEKFGFRAISLQSQPVLALYSQGAAAAPGCLLWRLAAVIGR